MDKPSGEKCRAIFAVFPLLFYAANLYRMTGHANLPYLLSIYIVGIIGWLAAFRALNYDARFFILICVYLLSGLLNYFLIGNIDLKDLGADVFFFGIAFLMLIYPCSYRTGVAFFYLTTLVFVVFYLRGGQARDLLTSSQNYVSILLIIHMAVYYYALHESGRKMAIWDLLPPALSFMLSVWARGRGGILSAAVFFVLMVLVFLHDTTRQSQKGIVAVLTIGIIVCIVFAVRNISVSNWFFSLGKWGDAGADNTARLTIWSRYFGKMTEKFSYILFGAPLREIPAIQRFQGNCHNSFIQLHAYNGLVMFCLFIAVVAKAFKRYISGREWLMASVLFGFCLRAFTDKFVFGQYGMPVMMLLVMYPWIAEVKKPFAEEV